MNAAESNDFILPSTYRMFCGSGDAAELRPYSMSRRIRGSAAWRLDRVRALLIAALNDDTHRKDFQFSAFPYRS